ncbi:MAG: glycosyltransferase family 9 protein [Bacteroidales bacterium]
MSTFDPNNINSFLVIQTASIGDVILATPVIEKIHANFPEAQIDFLLKKGNESLFEGHPYLHQLIVWDKSQDKYKKFRKIIQTVRETKYDVVVNLQRFGSTGFLTAFSKAKKTIGFDKNPFSLFFNHRIKHTIREGNKHETERNLSLLDPISGPGRFPIKLYPTPTHDARMSQFKTVKYITISPASLWFTKQYPAEKWIEFVKEVDPGTRIYFLGSQKDSDICDMIIQESEHTNSMNLAGKTSFLDTAVLMRDASMNFMNDSAPLHLASSVNAKTTAIFCSTVTSFGFGPKSDDAVVVETPLSLDCRPCGLHGFKSCPEGHFKCALTIDKRELTKRLS